LFNPKFLTLCLAERREKDIKWLPISGKNACAKTGTKRNKSGA
jgi:hypothetical protein